MFEISFPIETEVRDDESGLGFCLRAVAANGGRLTALKKLLGVGECERLKECHASQIARLCHVEEKILRQKLPRYTRSEVAKTRCYGHSFRFSGALRSRRPQVCPLCIAANHYTKDSWDIGLSTSCLIHRVRLVDSCQKCEEKLRWDRRSVEWGHCNHYLGGCTGTEASEALVMGQAVLDSLLRSENKGRAVRQAGLIPMLEHLSLDGWIQVLFAFGALPRPWSSATPGLFSRCPSSSEAGELVERAMLRLRSLLQGGMGDHGIDAFVAEAPLCGIIVNPIGTVDRDVGLRLYSMVFGRESLEGLARKNAVLRQMSLFEVF